MSHIELGRHRTCVNNSSTLGFQSTIPLGITSASNHHLQNLLSSAHQPSNKIIFFTNMFLLDIISIIYTPSLTIVHVFPIGWIIYIKRKYNIRLKIRYLTQRHSPAIDHLHLINFRHPSDIHRQLLHHQINHILLLGVLCRPPVYQAPLNKWYLIYTIITLRLHSYPDVLPSLCETSRQVASKLDAAVVDTLSTPTTTQWLTTTMTDLNTTSPSPSTTAVTYNCHGLEFEVDGTNPIINKPSKAVILYKKEHRPVVGSKDKADPIKLITSKDDDPYKEINTSCKDPKRLKNNLSLGQHLNHTESSWKSTDLLDLCYIDLPTGKGLGPEVNNDGSVRDMYLFTHYHQLDQDQKAASCKY